MQGQRTQQLAVTAKQSLQVIQTLLRVSFGCVAYLRDLLPDDNFTDGYLTTSGDDSFPQSPLATDGKLAGGKSPSGAIKVKTIKKDFSTEGNKLIQYLEEGIFEALQKQYLRSFIFAVYLDNEDPDNIIEAYTFNFSYHSVPGSTSKVPIMTLGERLEKMSLNLPSRATRTVDPAADAILKGISPTLGDVKRSVKNLVKTLITSMQLLHPLPKRRFGTFKLFYVDNVPEDYEPPHFIRGDPSNKYFFATHAKNEIPEKTSFGSVVTPHHSVELHIASISDVIPHGLENADDTARFGDLVEHETGSCPTMQTLTLAERADLISVQHQDALLRKVVWDAEVFANPEEDADAEGEYDSEYRGPSDVLSQKHRGVKCSNGTVVGINQSDGNETPDLRRFSGMKIDEPDSVKTMKTTLMQQLPSPTQIVEPTQHDPPDARIKHNPPPHAQVQLGAEDQEELGFSREMETPLVRRLLEQEDANGFESFAQSSIQDAEMLDLETQLPDGNHCSLVDDPITSFTNENSSPPCQAMETSQKNTVPGNDGPEHGDNDTNVEITQCDCGVSEDDDYGACQCEGPCGRWLHIWCMGYHSVDDTRLPHAFHCFTCRLRNDPQIEILDSRNLTSEYIARFKDLAFFRRALKIVETHRPENVTRFKELLGSEVSIAGQAWKRLEAEGFIGVQATEPDDIGLLETRGTSARKSKTKRKQRAQRHLKRARYVPVAEVMAGKAFHDYFEPPKEASLLGMKKLRHASTIPRTQGQDVIKSPEKSRESRARISNGPDQTQSETQFSVQAEPRSETHLESRSKRKCADEFPRNTKRMKISIGLGINLED